MFVPYGLLLRLRIATRYATVQPVRLGKSSDYRCPRRSILRLSMAAPGLLVVTLVLVGHASSNASDLHRAQSVPASVVTMAAGHSQPDILMSGNGYRGTILMSGS